jgi:ubiquinone/menaquinone biosynthesis C-methylase UbiE
MIIDGVDHNSDFDFGRASGDYAKYRDIYPESLYDALLSRGLCVKGQRVLDLGTGTGVLPRAMYGYGAGFTAADISPEQIGQAEKLSAGMNISYIVSPAESTGLPDAYFDVITAVQCFRYFNRDAVLPEIVRMLKDDGRFVIVWMTWLPHEDPVAAATEKLVLKFNPAWTGGGYTKKKPEVHSWAEKYFRLDEIVDYDQKIVFNHDTWTGRIRSCRGVAATLPPEDVERFDREHRKMLGEMTGDEFSIVHQITAHIYSKK